MKTMKNFAAQQLTKKQMNEVKGGVSGTCAFIVPGTNGKPDFIMEGVSKDIALMSIQGHSGARWCCDSCQDASWL